MNESQAYKEIVKRYFPPNSPIKIKKQLEGQTVNDRGNFVIGCRVGPEIEVAGLLHEMSHFSEREIPKLLEKPYRSWGFTFGKFYQIGHHWGYEPQTDQSVKREARVWAFQYNLMQSLGLDTTIEELVSSAVYLPAFSAYVVDKVRDQQERDKERLKYLAEEVFNLSLSYTLQKFESDWFERTEILSSPFAQKGKNYG